MDEELQGKKKYWNAAEDSLLKIYFFSGSTAIQKTRALNKVYPKLRYMGRVILERYFFKYNNPDMVNDAICHFLLKSKFDDTRGSYYSYTSNVLKNYFHSQIIEANNWKKFIDIDENYAIDNEDNLFQYADECSTDEFDYSDRELKLNKIICTLKDSIADSMRKMRLFTKRNQHTLTKRNSDTIDNYLTNERNTFFCKTAIKYFECYYLTTEISTTSMMEYIKNNSELTDYVIKGLTRKNFDCTSNTLSINTGKAYEKDYAVKAKSKVSYIQNDTMPSHHRVQISRINRKYKPGGTDDSDYHYM